ncbi:MAG TPA: hypothetical protein DD473_09985 [Planctomycetaceae bacterium]|nr:hypothetical protein [Planctomycetaceae bacterium]
MPAAFTVALNLFVYFVSGLWIRIAASFSLSLASGAPAPCSRLNELMVSIVVSSLSSSDRFHPGIVSTGVKFGKSFPDLA